MAILDRFRGKKKQKETIDKHKEQLLGDAGTIIEICRNSISSYTDFAYNEIKQKCRNRWGNPIDLEERILNALRFLVDNGICGFGGNVGDSIVYDKRSMLNLPTTTINFGALT